MRTFLIIGMFTASLASAAWRDYEESRNLTLDAGGIDIVEIEAGASSLEVRGSADAQAISVTALIQVPGKNEEKARRVIESDLVLTLERNGDRAVLNGYFESSGWGWGDSPSIRLEVEVPDRVALDIEDGAGSIKIWDVSGNIEIEDGSG